MGTAGAVLRFQDNIRGVQKEIASCVALMGQMAEAVGRVDGGHRFGSLSNLLISPICPTACEIMFSDASGLEVPVPPPCSSFLVPLASSPSIFCLSQGFMPAASPAAAFPPPAAAPPAAPSPSEEPPVPSDVGAPEAPPVVGFCVICRRPRALAFLDLAGQCVAGKECMDIVFSCSETGEETKYQLFESKNPSPVPKLFFI